ncbi:MAG: hypothetical protein HZA91_15635 [Verrucomicrobia bacterium]|nr:hypothetical protein [Verrucomicrobiota bacterium]
MLDSQSLAIWSFGMQAAAYAGAAIVFLIGIYQYRRGQIYKRASLLLDLVELFESDKRIRVACTMIDWDRREIPLEDGRTLKFENRLLVSALRTPPMDTDFTADENAIRDAFSAFLDFFQKIDSLWASRILRFKDLQYFYYWFELVHECQRYKKDADVHKRLHQFIDTYRFVWMRRLLERYGEMRARNPQEYELPI